MGIKKPAIPKEAGYIVDRAVTHRSLAAFITDCP